MSNSRQKYFIALVPPEPLLSQGWNEKKRLSEAYSTKAALRSPPHITLVMPFEYPEAKEASLVGSLHKVALHREEFTCRFEGYDSFGQRVIYWRVVPSEELSALQQDLVRHCRQQLSISLGRSDRPDRPFHPHLTLAFRDLRREQFQQAWREVGDRQFHAEWLVKDFALLKHDGKRWHLRQRMAWSGQE